MVAFLNVTLRHEVIPSAKIVKQDVLRFVDAIGKIERHFFVSCEVFTIKMKFDAQLRGDVRDWSDGLAHGISFAYLNLSIELLNILTRNDLGKIYSQRLASRVLLSACIDDDLTPLLVKRSLLTL